MRMNKMSGGSLPFPFPPRLRHLRISRLSDISEYNSNNVFSTLVQRSDYWLLPAEREGEDLFHYCMKRGGNLKPKQSTGFIYLKTIYYLICIVRSSFFLERKTLQPITERWFTAFGKNALENQRGEIRKIYRNWRGVGGYYLDLVTGHLHWNNFAQWLYRFNCCSSITAYVYQ